MPPLPLYTYIAHSSLTTDALFKDANLVLNAEFSKFDYPFPHPVLVISFFFPKFVS